MASHTETDSYFSVPFDLIFFNNQVAYDLFVNSSSIPGKEKFVRVFPRNDYLDEAHYQDLRKKYHQLYVPEKQRTFYLKSLVGSKDVSPQKKTEVIKDTAIKYLEKLFDPQKEFSTEVLNETITACRDVVESMVDTIQDFNLRQLYEMIANLSYHDFYTYDHSINVSMYCVSIYKHLRPDADRDEIILAGLGGLLHDLGKLNIPTSIINNPGQLSDEEFAEVKKHPDYGVILLSDSHCHPKGIDVTALAQVIHQHHENYNGSGYPNGLKGKDIHLLARITSIADFFDAITTKRSYHDVLSVEEAIDVMEKAKGKKIDPDLFMLFTQMVKTMALHERSDKTLPADFDPCRPYFSLPFQIVEDLTKPKFLGKIETPPNIDLADIGKVIWNKEKDQQKKKKQEQLKNTLLVDDGEKNKKAS